ncbi:MAG: 50S ribosomal protein L22 [Nanobdellota archaeon]
MVTTKYSFKDFDDHTVRAYGSSLDISTKAAITICNAIRGMDARKAMEYLKAVTDKKQAVPYTRFTDGVGHRKGKMASGRYPVKAAMRISKVIASAMANAAVQGMDDALKIVHISADKASTPMHQGRQTRRSMKRTHVQIVLREDENRAKAKKSVKKQPKKTSTKKTVSQQATGKQETAKKTAAQSSTDKQDVEKSTPEKSQSSKTNEVSQ